MPRRHRRPDRARARRDDEPGELEWHADGQWVVRRSTGAAAVKPYRCPGCQQLIPPAMPHVVAWPADGDVAERRHWHSPCWAARHRRGPTGRHPMR